MQFTNIIYNHQRIKIGEMWKKSQYTEVWDLYTVYLCLNKNMKIYPE